MAREGGQVPAVDDRTSGFGGQLRWWRHRRGLTQLELAARAGTTSRHVSFLETGRSRPRTEMVLRLAAELALPPREQNALLEAAGLRRVFPERALEDSEMARYREVIDSLLGGHEPFPAAVLDRYGAIRRTNRAFERLTPDLVGLPPEDLVDRFFGPGPWREAFVDVEEVVAAWVARQRLESHRTGDPRIEALMVRARELVGPLPDRAGGQDMPSVCTRIRSAGGETLDLFTVVVRFDAAQDVTLSELRLELMYPANDTADRFFRPAGDLAS